MYRAVGAAGEEMDPHTNNEELRDRLEREAR